MLTHQGVTLVRDRDATLQPPATRLSPTEAELRPALGELEGGRADRVVVQGSMRWPPARPRSRSPRRTSPPRGPIGWIKGLFGQRKYTPR
jgi:hypothetical protein